jgi:hypothetical protein
LKPIRDAAVQREAIVSSINFGTKSLWSLCAMIKHFLPGPHVSIYQPSVSLGDERHLIVREKYFGNAIPRFTEGYKVAHRGHRRTAGWGARGKAERR